MNEAAKSAWCREHGVYPGDLDKWRASCTTALVDPQDAPASPQATRADRKRIKEVELDQSRSDRDHDRELSQRPVVAVDAEMPLHCQRPAAGGIHGWLATIHAITAT